MGNNIGNNVMRKQQKQIKSKRQEKIEVKHQRDCIINWWPNVKTELKSVKKQNRYKRSEIKTLKETAMYVCNGTTVMAV